MSLRTLFAYSDRCTICLQSNIFRSVAEAECGPRNGAYEAERAEHHVEVTPSVLDQQVRTQDELTNDVQDSTTCTGHCIRKTECETELFLKPTAKYTSGHQPEQRDLGETDEDTCDVPLPDDSERGHCEECARNTNTCKGADNTNVKLLKQHTDDWREDNFAQIDN